MEQVIPPENEFLKLLENSQVGIQVKEEEDDNALDEDALEAEISKSALVNLVEGALVEAVRQGASDIHIIAKEGNRTEFWFRVDGNLQALACAGKRPCRKRWRRSSRTGRKMWTGSSGRCRRMGLSSA